MTSDELRLLEYKNVFFWLAVSCTLPLVSIMKSSIILSVQQSISIDFPHKFHWVGVNLSFELWNRVKLWVSRRMRTYGNEHISAAAAICSINISQVVGAALKVNAFYVKMMLLRRQSTLLIAFGAKDHNGTLNDPYNHYREAFNRFQGPRLTFWIK